MGRVSSFQSCPTHSRWQFSLLVLFPVRPLFLSLQFPTVTYRIIEVSLLLLSIWHFFLAVSWVDTLWNEVFGGGRKCGIIENYRKHWKPVLGWLLHTHATCNMVTRTSVSGLDGGPKNHRPTGCCVSLVPSVPVSFQASFLINLHYLWNEDLSWYLVHFLECGKKMRLYPVSTHTG